MDMKHKKLDQIYEIFPIKILHPVKSEMSKKIQSLQKSYFVDRNFMQTNPANYHSSASIILKCF